MDGWVGFHCEEMRHGHTSGSRDAGQIIAEQIDDHQIFRALFRVRPQRFDDRGIVRAARGGSLHRLGRDLAVLQCEEEFGRQRQEPILPRPDDAAVARLRAGTETGIEGQRVTGGGNISPQRQVRLIYIARRDVRLHSVKRGGILRPRGSRLGSAYPSPDGLREECRDLVGIKFSVACKPPEPEQGQPRIAGQRRKLRLQRMTRFIGEEPRPMTGIVPDMRQRGADLCWRPRDNDFYRSRVKAARRRAFHTGIIEEDKRAFGQSGHGAPLAGQRRARQS